MAETSDNRLSLFLLSTIYNDLNFRAFEINLVFIFKVSVIRGGYARFGKKSRKRRGDSERLSDNNVQKKK